MSNATSKRPRRFLKELTSGEAIDEIFLVRDKDLRTTRNGDLFILCTLCDRSGQMTGKMWQATETIHKSIPVGGFLHLKGRVDDYRGALQIIMDACRPIGPDKVDLCDFQAVSEHDPEQMWAELVEVLRQVKDPALRLLIKRFLADEKLVAAYKRSPAAVQMHHPFVGGLLEHTLGIARAASALLPLYPDVNADLVLVGAFLHDIGKTSELSSGTSVSYTQRGMLVGHITQAAIWVGEKAAEVAAETGEPFPQKTLDLLQHMILSHHGVHEYGSPKLPMIPESFMLHYLDNLDAKMWMCRNIIECDPDEESGFTAYQRQLETRLFKHSGDLAPAEEPDKSRSGRGASYG